MFFGGTMIEPGLRGKLKKENLDEVSPSGYTFHSEYKVNNEDGVDVGINLLVQYYGELWKPTLDRVTGKIDGHLFAISHHGYRFDVYRKSKPDDKRIFPPLRLVRT